VLGAARRSIGDESALLHFQVRRRDRSLRTDLRGVES
jgi:hypothetical protein